MNKQTFGMVFGAEFRRIALRTSTLVAMGIFAVAALLLSFGFVALAQFAAANASEEIAVTAPSGLTSLGLPYGLICFLFCIFTAITSAHDYSNGAAAATLVLVPNRGRLLGARVAVWGIMGFLQMFVPGIILAIVFMGSMGGLGQALLSVLLCSCSVSLYGLIVFGVATLVRRGAFAVVIYFLIDIVVPLVMPMASGIPTIGGALSEATHYMPNAVTMRLADLTLIGSDTVAWVIAIAASLAWVALVLVLGRLSFNRYAGKTS